MDLTGKCEVTQNEGSNFAQKFSIPVFVETSAKTKENLDLLFNKLAAECYNKKDEIQGSSDRKTFRLGTTVNRQGEDMGMGEKKSGCC